MANRAYLYVSNSDGPPDSETSEKVLGSNYFIPGLWLTSLIPEELRHENVDHDDDERYYFCVPAPEALARCKDKHESLEMFVTNVDAYFQSWERFLQSLGDKYIQIEVSEILWMDDQALPDLRHALTFLDSPSEQSAESFLRITALNEVYNNENNAVQNTEGPTVAELTGEADERRLPEREAETYMLGYAIADWVSWATPPANSNEIILTRWQKFGWNPLAPFIGFTYVLYEVVGIGVSTFGAIALSLTGSWLALSIYNFATAGKFTNWLYHKL